jgi:transcriptional regulator GlxA family with amidase domain
MPPETIDVLVYEGFDELDAIGPYEVLSNVDRVGADVTVSLVTLTPTDRVTASHGLRVEPDGTLDPTAVDLLVVPGGGWNDRAETGAWAEAQAGDVPDALASAADAGATLATVCTGGMLAATAGLADGRPAITHASAIDDLREAGATVVDARAVDDGDLLSAGGVTAGMDLAFHIVAREWGEDAATQIASEMEYEPSEDVYVSGEG